MDSANLLTAVFAGIISFMSPCVLPLVPGYLSFITGVSLQELQSDSGGKVLSRTFLCSLWFVFGFSVVFILLGASATLAGKLLLEHAAFLSRLAGGIIVVFGLHLIGLFRIPFLEYEKKVHVRKKPLNGVGIFLVGAAFGFGWTPCVGPFLATVLAIAGAQQTVGKGMLLLTAYSLGLGIPFLLSSLSVSFLLQLLRRFRWLPRAFEILGGVLLVSVGVLLLTGGWNSFVGWFAQFFPFLNRFAL